MTFRAAVFTAALLVTGCGLSAGDGPSLHHPDLTLDQVANKGEASSALFTSYNPNGPVRWNQGWPWKFDLSGVAWDNPRAATAITRRHVVMAAHYTRGKGKPLVFHDRKGRPHQRFIVREMSFREAGSSGDVAIGLLDRPLPDAICSYPLLEPGRDGQESLKGARVLVTEQKRRLFFHQISQVSESSIRFQYDARLPDIRKKKLIGGDSGNPSFILSHGELVLIETHSGGGAGTGPFYGSPKLISTIRKIVADLDPKYPIRTVALDAKVLKDAETGRASFPKPPPPTVKPPAQNPAAPQPARTPRPRTVTPPG